MSGKLKPVRLEYCKPWQVVMLMTSSLHSMLAGAKPIEVSSDLGSLVLLEMHCPACYLMFRGKRDEEVVSVNS